MSSFDRILFNGEFRDYQKNVLDNLDRHMANGKIHVVAAPGSGKTILGLEIIRRLGNSALVLSPSVTIRQQWGERFAAKFLHNGELLEDYFSYDLKAPGLVTSVTYQALHAAWKKTVSVDEPTEDEGEGKPDDESQQEDFSGFDLIAAIKVAGIKTLCLDEAHHLRSEWQKALEAFVAAVQSEMTVVSLTATPPYDSTGSEWDRYISMCGEIDEEIFVPQLVAQGSLCPHQDYIYFNYPTAAEMEAARSYQAKALACTQEIVKSPLLDEILIQCGILTNFRGREEEILENAKGYVALLSLAQAGGRIIPKGVVQLLLPEGKLPGATLHFAETAFSFVAANPAIFSEETSEKLKKELMQCGLVERREIRLAASPGVTRSLLSSIGKLESIQRIVEAESAQMGQSLRMLVLTDHIRKDCLRLVGTENPIDAMGTVPVFEAVRRAAGSGIRAAVLTGSLVIVPNASMPAIRDLARERSVPCSSWQIRTTDFSEMTFDSSNKNKVELLTEAFRRGWIHILVGTKSLLGEGWDSPCINSLILASFVGSFMLSNQMRGRAIRIDPEHLDKVSNIWHLVTVEPPFLDIQQGLARMWSGNGIHFDRILGEDFQTLVRRFECFLAPSYDGTAIESGIDRVSILKPPFHQKGIEAINSKMLAIAGDRDGLAERWKAVVRGPLHPEIVEMSRVPKAFLPSGFFFLNLLNEAIWAGVYTAFSMVADGVLRSMRGFPEAALPAAIVVLALVYLLPMAIRIVNLFPKRAIRAICGSILASLRQAGEIQSLHTELIVRSNEDDTAIYCALTGATAHEKSVFAQAVGELLTAIDNPRYLVIKRMRLLLFSWKDYSQSYACPAILSAKKETVELFAQALERTGFKYDIQYTRNEEGRRELLRCRSRSYINRNDVFVKGKKAAVTQWD